MHATVHYADVGIRTRTGACWFAAFMVVNAVLTLFLRSHDLVQAATASFFLVMVLLSTLRSLRELGRLERVHATPTDAMKELFRLTLTQPIAGCLGLMIGLR